MDGITDSFYSDFNDYSVKRTVTTSLLRMGGRSDFQYRLHDFLQYIAVSVQKKIGSSVEPFQKIFAENAGFKHLIVSLLLFFLLSH